MNIWKLRFAFSLFFMSMAFTCSYQISFALSPSSNVEKVNSFETVEEGTKPMSWWKDSVDHLRTFERTNNFEVSDLEARVWQRGYRRHSSNIFLEPSPDKDHYGMALDIRF